MAHQAGGSRSHQLAARGRFAHLDPRAVLAVGDLDRARRADLDGALDRRRLAEKPAGSSEDAPRALVGARRSPGEQRQRPEAVRPYGAPVEPELIEAAGAQDVVDDHDPPRIAIQRRDGEWRVQLRCPWRLRQKCARERNRGPRGVRLGDEPAPAGWHSGRRDRDVALLGPQGPAEPVVVAPPEGDSRCGQAALAAKRRLGEQRSVVIAHAGEPGVDPHRLRQAFERPGEERVLDDVLRRLHQSEPRRRGSGKKPLVRADAS